MKPDDMVGVPAGTIVLRDARTETTRDVELEAFAIGRTPVTWSLYSSVLEKPVPLEHHPDAPVHTLSWISAVEWCNAASRYFGRAPVYTIDQTRVTWDIAANGYRLPTEAEWERSCRAGTTGPSYGPLKDIAWTAADQCEGPQPVGRKEPNDLGIFDMLGNVWEWCFDYTDPARYADYRTIRGGGWADKHWSTRASVRRGSMPITQLDDIGFRLAHGATSDPFGQAFQGWSHQADLDRARVNGPLPFGWTPLRQ